MNEVVQPRRDFLRTVGVGLAAAALPRRLWAEAPRSGTPGRPVRTVTSSSAAMMASRSRRASSLLLCTTNTDSIIMMACSRKAFLRHVSAVRPVQA